MIVTTLDPISLQDVTDLEGAPFVIEGEGDDMIKIYFVSDVNRQTYLNTPLYGSNDDSSSVKEIQDEVAGEAISHGIGGG